MRSMDCMRKKILVLTTSLSSGGITSFTVNLVNMLAKDHDITLLYTQDKNDRLRRFCPSVDFLQYKYPNKYLTVLYMLLKGWGKHLIKIKYRDHNRVTPMESIQRMAYAQAMNVRLPNITKKTTYDIAISTAEFFCNDVVAFKVKSKRKVAWIHPDYKALEADVLFDRITLDCFDNIVSVSKSTRQSLIDCIPEYDTKALYIPNLLDTKMIKENGVRIPKEYKAIDNKHIIVTVCRMDNSSKRLDRIIPIVKKLIEHKQNIIWYIVGDGPDYQLMKDLVTKNNLQEYVVLLGNRNNPYPYIKNANVFVLVSQYEGKPVVVDEALELCCPVITTRYTSADEQVTPECGIIIENNDMTIAEEFCSVLDWKHLNEIKKFLELNDYGESINQVFESQIAKVLG